MDKVKKEIVVPIVQDITEAEALEAYTFLEPCCGEQPILLRYKVQVDDSDNALYKYYYSCSWCGNMGIASTDPNACKDHWNGYTLVYRRDKKSDFSNKKQFLRG